MLEGSSTIPSWVGRWKARVDSEGRDVTVVAKDMDEINPLYIPRNHLVDEALTAATAGDIEPFNTLLETVTHPFDERDGFDRFAQPAESSFNDSFETFCGT